MITGKDRIRENSITNMRHTEVIFNMSPFSAVPKEGVAE